MMLRVTKREQIGAIVLAVLLIVGLVMRYAFAPKPKELIITPPQAPALQTDVKKTEIMVHVAGAVRSPGVYTLAEGARVFEAIAAAGGALLNADEHALNLAEPLYDGRRITVPYQGTDEQRQEENTGKININTASTAELDALPGIGPTRAAAITAYREKNGPFSSLDDLAKVTGIGPSTVENLREFITLY